MSIKRAVHRAQWGVVPLLTLALALVLALPAGGLAERWEGTRRWSGVQVLEEAVTVPPGATLVIEAGTVVRPLAAEAKLTVRGTLEVAGTQEQPVLFAGPADWAGIEFLESLSGGIIVHARFARAKAAISSLASNFSVRNSEFRDCGVAIQLLRESDPLIEGCLFIANRVGLDNQMKSAPQVRDNRFEEHSVSAIQAGHNSRGPIEGNVFEKNKQAIGVVQKYLDPIADNRFSGNETAIFCNQTQATPLIRGNRFEDNRNALVNFSFSYPVVEHNSFLGSDIAVRNDQFGSPRVAHNLFADNGTAIYNYRKANPKVLKNIFLRNRLILYCDFSSYPTVKENNFEGNTVAVELGKFQSADWEKKSGSKALVQKQASARQSQNPLLAQAPTEFTDIVDVSGNWWGDQTALLAAAGQESNLDLFFDRHDTPEVTYEGYGFGEQRFRLDIVRFSPWLEGAVADAGPNREAP